MQRLAVLTTALGQSPPDPDLIYEAMKDRVHQPYRKLLVRPLFKRNLTVLMALFGRFLDCPKSLQTLHPRRTQDFWGSASLVRDPLFWHLPQEALRQ